MGELIRLCAWCNIDLDKLQGKERQYVKGEDLISHGLCKKCAKEYLDISEEELEEYEKKSDSNDSVGPVALMRLTQIEDPDELLKDFRKENIIIEEKLDGWKTQIINSDNKVKIYSRKGEDKTENFPQLVKLLSFLPNNTMVEGELVYWEDGKQEESKVTSIAGSSPETSIKKQKELPGEMKIHLYDILWVDGKNISKDSFEKRREILESIVNESELIKITKQYSFDQWQDAMNEAVESGGEGIVLKIKNQSYEFKELGENEPKPKGVMYKYKGGIGKSETDDYVVFDYDVSEKGNLKAFFGQYCKGKLYYISDISNFSQEDEDIIKSKLKDGPFVVELGFQERVPGGLRHQKFIRYREDKSPKDATMNEFHVKNLDNFEIVKEASLESTAGFIEDMIKKLERMPKTTKDSKINMSSVPGVDTQKAYQIISKIESNNSFAVGDSGTSFGKTQVHLSSFLNSAAQDPNIKNLTGLEPAELKSFSSAFEENKKILSNYNWKKQTQIDKNDVLRFIKNNPDKIRNRKEGKIIKMFPNGQPGVVIIRNNKIIAEVLDLNALYNLGLNVSSYDIRNKIENIMKNFLTWAVVRNSLARILTYQKMPKTHDKIMNTFSSKNINNNPELLKLTDRISQIDLSRRIQAVVNAVKKSGYDTSAPGAYNIYQLIAISNAGGVGAVENFLESKKPFSPGYLTYLVRANPEIQNVVGVNTQMPPDGGLSGFASFNSTENIIKEASYSEPGFLYFPAQYAEDIKSGKRKITIRAMDVPVEVAEIVSCMTYSGSPICDVRINAKNRMSIGRIEKAYGKRMAKSLERQFGPAGQFTVVKFEPWVENSADDDKWDEILIDNGVKLTRQKIKDHYMKPTIRKKIMERIKDKPVLIYLGIEKNENILKRNHDDKPIIITNDDVDKSEETNNYFYWVNRRLLSIHEVFGKETNIGFVDLDLHGDYPLNKAKEYAKEVSKKIKEKYGVQTTIYNSGGTGIHIEFELKEKQSINKLRAELKKLLDELNEGFENVTTGVVKGNGMRSDVSTLHNKGSLRVPGSLGETYGKEKKQIVEADNNDLEYGTLNIQENAFEESGAISPAGRISNEGTEPYSYAMDKLQTIWKIAETIGNDKKPLSEKKKRELEEAKKWLQEHSGELSPGSGLSENEELAKEKKKKRKQSVPETFSELASKPGVTSLFDKKPQKKVVEEKPEAWWEKEDIGKLTTPVKKSDLPKKPPARLPLSSREIEQEENQFDVVVDEEKIEDKGEVEEFETIEEQLEREGDNVVILTPSQICDMEGSWIIPCEEVYKTRDLYNENMSAPGIRKKINKSVVQDLSSIENSNIKNEEPSDEGKNIQPESEPESLAAQIENNANDSSFGDPVGDSFTDDDVDVDVVVDDTKPEETLAPIDAPVETISTEFNFDDLLEEAETIGEDKDKTKIERKLIYGGPLLVVPSKTIKSADGYDKSVPLESWPEKIDSIEKLKESGISNKIAMFFTPEKLSSGKSLRELFLDKTGVGLKLLEQEPNVVQEYILPYLISSLGQVWFDNNKSKTRIGGSPFSLWGANEKETAEFASYLEKEHLRFEETQRGRTIIVKINEVVTHYANKYFSFYQTSLPIDSYIYDYLDKDMRKFIAGINGFQEKKLVLCAICKNESFENSLDASMEISKKKTNYGRMVKLDSKTRHSLWECPNCKKRLNDISYEMSVIKNRQSRINKKIKEIQTKDILNEDDEQIISNFNSEFTDLESKKQILKQSEIKYSNQLRVPRIHTWCPNNECPGKSLIPLTSIDWDNEFWQTKEAEDVLSNLKIKFEIEPPQSIKKIIDIQSANDISDRFKGKHIAPDWMLNIPFVCPFDGVKFTLKSSKNEGVKGRAGYLWDPWQKATWEVSDSDKIITPSDKSDEETESSGEGGLDVEKMEDKNEGIKEREGNVFVKKIADLARKSLINKYWDVRNEFLEFTSSKFNSFDTAIRNKSVMGQFRNLALYDSILQSSSFDEISFLGWLCRDSVEKKLVISGKKVIEKRDFAGKKKEENREAAMVPVLQKWVDTMLSRGKTLKDGFEQYNLSSWLVNEESNGIKSKLGDKFGTFFVSEVKEGGKSLKKRYGIVKFELKDSVRKGKELQKTKIIKILNVFKINKSKLNLLNSGELSGNIDIKDESKVNELISDLTENITSNIVSYNFYKGNVEMDSNLVVGDYVLIQALVISMDSEHPAIVSINKIRKENDEDGLFEDLRQVVKGEEEPVFWKHINEVASKREVLLEKDLKGELENLKRLVAKNVKFRKEKEDDSELEKTSDYKISIRAADPLKRYKSKRDFDKTNEPEGKVESKNKYRFVIQKHDATNLHFDLRLENDDGVLQSWALPKHKMPEGKEKLLAVETEPHPIEYAKFKGDIEEGYGEGHVDIWASGKYEPVEIKKDKIVFKINSGKAEGTFILFRTDGKKWMLMRKKD